MGNTGYHMPEATVKLLYGEHDETSSYKHISH